MTSPSRMFSESAVWLCRNRQTGYQTRISGPLADILHQYPKDYKLRLLKIKEPAHGHAPATD